MHSSIDAPQRSLEGSTSPLNPRHDLSRAMPPVYALPIAQDTERSDLSRTGFIDHIGIGVSDLAAAKDYYDELMPILGFRPWFPTAPDGAFNYGPDGARGPQLFFYQAIEDGNNSRNRAGLQHIAIMVQSRAMVHEAYEWAVAKGEEILYEPRLFPEYGPSQYATYWQDPNGFMLEVVTHVPEEE